MAARLISLRKCVCVDSKISISALRPACCRRLARPLAARIRKLPAVERILAALPIRVRSGSVKLGRPPFFVQHAAIAAAPTGADMSDLIPLAQARCAPRKGSEHKLSQARIQELLTQVPGQTGKAPGRERVCQNGKI